MSVVVRMKFPSHCEYCPMCRLYRENGRVWCNAANRILKQEWKNPDWTELDIPKPDWCPIICKLPTKHGRLLDERTVYDKIAEQEGGNYVDMDAVDLALQETPFIVPAEGDFEHE